MSRHVTIKNLATVKTVKPTYAVLYSEKVGDVLVLVSDWLRYKDYDGKRYGNNSSSTSPRIEDMQNILKLNELVYFEGYFYRGVTRNGYRADRIEKTTQGRGIIKRLHETYGFLHSPTLKEDIFFPGSSLQDNFCGWKNLEKTLRPGDEVRFVAVKEIFEDGVVRYKAVAVAVPNMGKENDDNCLGVIVETNCYHAKIYCRPLDEVFLMFPSAGPDRRLKAGQRLKFSCKRVDERYEAVGAYEILPDEFIFTFPKITSNQKPATSVESVKNGEEIENKINTVLEKNDVNVRKTTETTNDDGGDSSKSDGVNNNVISSNGAECGDDVCWSDLEKELEELTCDVSLQRLRSTDSTTTTTTHKEENTDELSASAQSSANGCGGENFRQPTINDTTENMYKRIRTCSNDIFNGDGAFSRKQFSKDEINSQNNNNNNNNDKDIWTPFSPGSSLDLSHTQTSLNEDAPAKLSRNLSPVSVVETWNVVGVGQERKKFLENAVKLDAECQVNLCEEPNLLRELMHDDETLQFIAVHRPTWMLKWCKLQQKR